MSQCSHEFFTSILHLLRHILGTCDSMIYTGKPHRENISLWYSQRLSCFMQRSLNSSVKLIYFSLQDCTYLFRLNSCICSSLYLLWLMVFVILESNIFPLILHYTQKKWNEVFYFIPLCRGQFKFGSFLAINIYIKHEHVKIMNFEIY